MRRRLKIVALAVLLLSLFGWLVQAGIGVSPSLIFATVTEAHNSFYTTVSNTGEDALKISAYAAGMSHNLIGGINIKEGKEDLEKVTRVFSLDPKEFVLEAGEVQEVKITVNIAEAKKIGPSGGAYAEILFEARPLESKGGQVTNVARIGVPTLVTLPGPKELTGKITQVSVEQAKPGDKVQINIRFRNTGNTHYTPKGGTVVIRDETGSQVAKIPVETHVVMPGLERRLTASWSPKELPVGTYTVEATVGIVEGEVTPAMSAAFGVVEPYKVAQPSGGIINFAPPKADKNKPIEFKLLFSNRGNVDLTPKGEIRVEDSREKVIATIPIAAQEEIVPGSSAEMSAVLEGGLPTGEYTAIAELRYGKPEYGGVKVAQARIEFEVAEKEIVTAGEIVEFTVPSVKSGEPIVPHLLIKNTGNTDFEVEGLIELKNSAGKSVGQIPIPKTPVAVGETKALGQPWEGTLPVGLYKAVASLILGGEKMLTAETSFMVKQ